MLIFRRFQSLGCAGSDEKVLKMLHFHFLGTFLILGDQRAEKFFRWFRVGQKQAVLGAFMFLFGGSGLYSRFECILKLLRQIPIDVVQNGFDDYQQWKTRLNEEMYSGRRRKFWRRREDRKKIPQNHSNCQLAVIDQLFLHWCNRFDVPDAVKWEIYDASSHSIARNKVRV